jgi:uncharacterized membrane protein
LGAVPNHAACFLGFTKLYGPDKQQQESTCKLLDQETAMVRSRRPILETNMSEHEQQAHNQQQDHTSARAEEPKCRLRRRTRFGIAAFVLVGLGAVAGAVLVGTIGVSAFAGHGYHAGHHAGHGAPHYGQSMERLEAHMQRKTMWILRALETTSEQRDHVDSVLSGTLAEVYPLVEQHRENRTRWLDELSKPELDPEALETLRERELMLMDSMSLSLVNAFTSVAEILTPDQRRELMEGMRSHYH